MKAMYDFEGEHAQTYKGQCSKCNGTIEVSTERDEYPEYYTNVYVKCECVNSVGFSLPVN